MTAARPAERPSAAGKLALAGLAGAAVAVFLGVYGRTHDIASAPLFTLFFSASINLKVWFATAAFVLALFQVGSAMRLYGKVGAGPASRWLGPAHRISGTLAFLVSLPVAYHCLYSLGFQTGSARVVAHSLLGCFFYGAFAAKVLCVRMRGLPSWALPLAGGAVFVALAGLWLTASVWYFTTVRFPGF